MLVRQSEHYWDDVNRYTDEILAGLPVDTRTDPFVSREVALYEWNAQEQDASALLRKDTYRILGFVATHYHLGIVRLEPDTTVIHFIRFDPAHNQIVRVQDDVHPHLQERTLSEYARDLWRRHRFAKKAGILLPTDADYTLLHTELQRGAEFRLRGID